MIFYPPELVPMQGRFVFSENVTAKASHCLSKAIFSELWHNFSFRASSLTVEPCNEFVFSIGAVDRLPLDGAEYSINVSENGIYVYAESERSLLHGFMTLLDRIRATEDDSGIKAQIDACQIKDRAAIQTRMVHFCIFPETEPWELQRFIRFCGALKYTHVVLEFWGMLRYDCMKELAWSHAFTKEELRPILREASDLGLEIIPMFNHWGHASGGRVMHGKHVVLDQNPALQTYFSDDGWCWNLQNPKVRNLLKCVREELIDLCGDGEYFHIGCDEAYNFDLSTSEGMDAICDFMNEVAKDLCSVGRRLIVWGDMFLFRHPSYNPKNRYTCNAPRADCEQYMLTRLSKDIMIADWQYDAPEAPVETASVFHHAGFDCMLCPWDRGIKELNAVLETVKSESLTGVLMTTWHTLTKGMPLVTMAAVGAYNKVSTDLRYYRTETAALLRKVFPANGNYERAGWAKYQIGIIT